MRKRVYSLVVVITVALFYLLTANTQSKASTVNISEYLTAGGVGDWWTYTYAYPLGQDDFTVSLTEVTEAPYAGKYRIGDYRFPDSSIQWFISDRDENNIYVYYDNSYGPYEPPVVIGGLVELNQIIGSPFPQDNDCPWYFKKQDSLTVPAGTFDDILVHIALDMNYGPNAANDLLGLDRADIPYAVTHVSWIAHSIGEVMDIDIDASSPSGDTLFAYQLKGTSIPIPSTIFLLAAGLIGLLGFRRRSCC